MMKRLLLLSVLALFLSASSWAYDFTAENEDGVTIYYNILSEEDLTCEVTGLRLGPDVNPNKDDYTGTVVIPETAAYLDNTYSVVAIGKYAFSSCMMLTSVSIPNSVTSIGDYAFYYCSGLTSLTIGNNVTSIGEKAFEYCTSLTGDLTLPNSLTEIGRYAFAGCSGLTGTLTIPENVTSIGWYAFAGCTGFTGTLDILGKLTSIGNYTFWGCAGIQQVTIPNSVTRIGIYAFYNCAGLTQVTIPNSVTSIGECSFEGCSGMSDLSIGNGVTEIGGSAFRDCTGLTSVTIGNSVTTIRSYAFQDCPALTFVTSLNSKPPTCHDYVFRNDPLNTCTLYVPEGTAEVYSSTSPWKDFFFIEEIEVDAIEDITTNGNAEAVGYYTTDGKQVPTLQRGINIIRYSDGSAKKVLVK